MELKINMLTLEEEMTKFEDDSLQDEKNNAKLNYDSLDKNVSAALKNIPYPNISKYSISIDYEDNYDLQSKKRINKKYEEKINFLREYANDGSLYCGHFKIGTQDVYLMDHSQHRTIRFKRIDETELFLLNVNDKLYQNLVNMWRFPTDYRNDVILSRNIILKNRNVIDVDVVYENSISAFSDITDNYLRKALLRNKDNPSTQGIIQTIQKKQDNIRTYNTKKSFIVQGCAGSGKTMVLLHRIRYLLYNNEINNAEYILLIPSIGFRFFINELSQKFNIIRSNILSYQEYYGALLDKKILEEDIKDESVFNDDYLYEVYSESFLKNSYRDFFMNIINQTESLTVFCDECLTKKSNEEYEKLIDERKKTNNNILKAINESLENISSYIGISKLNSLDEVHVTLDILQDECDNRRTLLNLNIENNDNANHNDLESKIVNNKKLTALKIQIEREKVACENASRYTKLSHEKKLAQLELNYNQQKEELIKYLNENDESNRKKAIAKINDNINIIIVNKMQFVIDRINELLNNFQQQRELLDNTINEFEEIFLKIYEEPIELLNGFIENSSCISDFEKEYIDPLNPSYKAIQEIIEKGIKVAASCINNNLYDKEKLLKNTKLFTQRTIPQLNSYLFNLLFSSIKNKIYRKYNIRLCKLYKHYWYLQLYCRYLLTPFAPKKSKYIFIDEAQDLSPTELELIYKINSIYSEDNIQQPVFNLFGDVNQTVSSHGIKNWDILNFKFDLIELNENFRNTNQIVEYCNTNLPYNMKKIGVNMNKVVDYFNLDEAIKRNKKIKKEPVIIVKNEFVKEDFKKILDSMKWKYGYNVITVKEAKGLEFKEVFVIDCQMNNNEKYIAYTRALANLIVIHNMPISENHQNLIIDGDDSEEEFEETKTTIKDNNKKIVLISRLFEQKNKGISQIKLINIIKQLK